MEINISNDLYIIYAEKGEDWKWIRETFTKTTTLTYQFYRVWFHDDKIETFHWHFNKLSIAYD